MSERWNPRAYQIQAVKFLLEHACAGLFMDPSMGKTSIAYSAFRLLRSEGLARRMLVIAPLRVAQLVWPAEAAKWTDFSDLKVFLLHGEGRTDEALRLALKDGVQVFVINPDGLRWLFSEGRFARLDADTLVVDELTKFKHTQTQRFKSLKPFLPRFQRRWGLTGSPAANGLMDLFGQCYVLDLGRTLGQFITHYRMQYFDPTGYGGYTWVLKESADQRIYERLKPLVLRLDADDHLDLPEVVTNEVFVKLPREARRVYDALERDLFVKLDQDLISPANAGAAMMMCRQVAAGGLYLADDGHANREWRKLHDEKTEAVQILLDELQGSPALIAYDFKHDLARLLAAFPKLPYLGGGVSQERFGDVEAAWNRGELPAVAVHPQSVAHGLNIQFGGHHLICHTIPDNYEHYLQLIFRLRRPGSRAKRVFVHNVIARDTVDEVVNARNLRKEKGQRALLDALRQYAGRRRGG